MNPVPTEAGGGTVFSVSTLNKTMMAVPLEGLGELSPRFQKSAKVIKEKRRKTGQVYLYEQKIAPEALPYLSTLVELTPPLQCLPQIV